MIFYNALDMKFRDVTMRDRNPECVSCGDNPSVTDVTKFDYDEFC